MSVFDTEASAPSSDGIDTNGRSSVRIIADESKNALLIMATPRQYKAVEAALRKLDMMPLQVMIEATIAEVTLNDDLKFGVEWFLQQGNNRAAFSTAATGAVASAFPGFSYLFSGGKGASAVLNTLASLTNVRVISSPQILVMDNQTAKLQVGDQVPIATQSAVSIQQTNAPIVNTLQYRDTGVILEVTPRVNPGGPVFMEIKQEVSDVAKTTTSGIDSPTIQQRKITSTVAVQSDQPVALGGLIKDAKNETRSGVPVLSEVPVLGGLFRTTNNRIDRTELMVIITPRVVRDPTDAQRVTDDLRKRMRTLTPLDTNIR